MKFLLALLLVALSASARAETPVALSTTSASPALSTSERDGFVRVFLDCPYCDESYFKTEAPFVNFVRSREDAEVHVLVTTQTTGSGGTEYTLAFLGRGRFLSLDDGLKYVAPAGASEDDTRAGILHVFELGLVRYLAHSSAAKEIGILYSAPAEGSGARHDPWDSWTFRLSGHGSFQGQQSTLTRNLSTSASANRITEDWKLSFNAGSSYGENRYRFEGPPVTRYVSITRSTNGGAEVVRSLAKKWAAALDANLSSSTYSNERFAASASAGIEYDLYPYSESTRRLLTLRYQAGEGYQRYFEETVYGRTFEYQPWESLTASAQVTEPWGTISGDLAGSHYVRRDGRRIDLGKNSASIDLVLDLKLSRGLSFTLFGSAAFVHDQIFLPRAGATEAEILLERKQLETSYTYSTSIGLSWTFGSIYSSVVNPRFGGASSSSSFFFF